MKTPLALSGEELLHAALSVNATHVFENRGNDQKIEVGFVAVLAAGHRMMMPVGMAVVDELKMQWSQG